MMRKLKAILRHDLMLLGRKSSLLFLSRVTGAAAVYLTQILLARWVGATELGIYVLAFSWCIVISQLAVIGFPTLAVKVIGTGLAHDKPGVIHGFVKGSRRIVLHSSFVFSALAGTVVLWRSSWQVNDNVIPFLIAFACVPFFSITRVQGGVAHGFSWFLIKELPNQLIRPLLLLLCIWIVWALGYPLSAMVVLLLHFSIIFFLYIGQTALVSYRMPREITKHAPEYRNWEWLKTGFPLFVISLFTMYYPEINAILVGMFLPESDVAVFNACFRTAFLIAFGMSAVNAVVLPRSSYLYAKKDLIGLQRVVSHASLIQFGGALVALIVLIGFGREILTIFGAEFVRGYDALVILGSALLIRSSNGVAVELLGVTGQQNRCLIVSIVGIAATVGINIWLIPKYGLMGGALTVLAVTAVSVVWINLIVVRRLGVYPSIFGVRRLRMASVARD